jgi:MATE family multidrug resistance protein
MSAAATHPRAELGAIARHAGAVYVGQVAVMAFGLADTFVAARHSGEALAALSVGSAVYVSIFVALMGVLQAQLPIWAELRGAGRQDELGFSVRQSLYVAAVASAVGMVLLLVPGPLLAVTEVPAALQDDVRHYLALLACALPATLLFRLYSTLNQSLGKPRLVTWIQIGSLFLKVPLAMLLVFGAGPLPALGLAGCAWSTVIVNWTMLGLAVWMLRQQALYRPYQLWRRPEPPHGPTLRGFARLGLPTGLSIMVEVTSFTLMALFIARLGTVAAASHQIAASMTALLYMTPLAFGIAASARVSYWLGAQQPQQARLAMRLGFALTLACALAMGGAVLAFHGFLARLFAGANLQVVAAAAALLPWVAVYHLFDALQAVSVFVLRSFGVATASLVVYCLMLWGVGLGGGYWLAYTGPGATGGLQTPAAFWGTGALALALTTAAFLLLLKRALRRTLPPQA